MFGSIFKPYGPVWNFCNTITDVLGLSLLWCFCCLPIVTIGAATTALYDAAVRGIRYKEPVVYRRFLRTFRAELKTSALCTLLWGAVLLFGSFVLALLREAGQESTAAALMAGGYEVLLLIPIGAACWSAAILSRFTYGFRSLVITAIRFLPAHLLASLGIAAATRITIWYVFDNPIALTFAPAALVLAWSLLAEPVFAKYGGSLQSDSQDGRATES